MGLQLICPDKAAHPVLVVLKRPWRLALDTLAVGQDHAHPEVVEVLAGNWSYSPRRKSGWESIRTATLIAKVASCNNSTCAGIRLFAARILMFSGGAMGL